MLDTNTASDLLRNPHGRVYVRLQQHGAATACLSIIAAAELRFGAVKRRAPQPLSRVETLLTKIAVLPFDLPCDTAYTNRPSLRPFFVIARSAATRQSRGCAAGLWIAAPQAARNDSSAHGRIKANGRWYHADLLTKLETAGTPISPNDLLIAAHAHVAAYPGDAQHGEFRRVPGSHIENWLE